MNETTANASTAANALSAIIGDSLGARALRRAILRFAPIAAPVLIVGETGSGKELVARAIHACSQRASRPYLAFNAATLTHGTGASELFGHMRGAFTGAAHSHRGLFEQADRGTLFLDEIGDLSPDGQAALLRVIEYGDLRAIGAEHSRRVDVRIVCATHRDLGELVNAKRFRADLAYRLGVLVIRVPPLRDRVDDIPLIAKHLLARHEGDLGPKQLGADAMGPLLEFSWPGNVRQLGAVLLRAALHADRDVIDRTSVEAALAEEQRALPRSDADCARQWARRTDSVDSLRVALEASGGRIAPAAKMLGLARSTVRDRIARYGLAIGEDRGGQ